MLDFFLEIGSEGQVSSIRGGLHSTMVHSLQ